MREIKFRAWDKKNNKMIYAEDWNTGCVITLEGQCGQTFWELLQYTGLKDKNGKEIYEGSVAKIVFRTELGITIDRNCVMKWLDRTAQWTFEFNSELEFTPDNDTIESVEIIGNTYENPDCLKEVSIKKELEQGGE